VVAASYLIARAERRRQQEMAAAFRAPSPDPSSNAKEEPTP